MQNKYVGDIGDYVKFAILRAATVSAWRGGWQMTSIKKTEDTPTIFTSPKNGDAMALFSSTGSGRLSLPRSALLQPLKRVHMLSSRRFPPPWRIDEANDACFIVRDSTWQALAYFYFEEEPGRRSAAKLLTRGRCCGTLEPPAAGLLCSMAHLGRVWRSSRPTAARRPESLDGARQQHAALDCARQGARR